MASSETIYKETLQAIRAHLTKNAAGCHSGDDLAGIAAVYDALTGAALRFGHRHPRRLMTATDRNGVARRFLASEERFQFMRGLQSRNLVVPVSAISAGRVRSGRLAANLKSAGATVSLLSLELEQYLVQDGQVGAFLPECQQPPLDAASIFIRSQSAGVAGDSGVGELCEQPRGDRDEVQACR